MTTGENKAIIHRWVEALNTKDLTSFDDLIAPDYVDMKGQGVESAKHSMTMFYTGFPDLRVTIEDIIAEWDKVWVRLMVMGTHTGDFGGVPPTGKRVTLATVDIFRIVDGKFVQGWTVNDFWDLYTQLGIIVPTEQGKQLFTQNGS